MFHQALKKASLMGVKRSTHFSSSDSLFLLKNPRFFNVMKNTQVALQQGHRIEAMGYIEIADKMYAEFPPKYWKDFAKTAPKADELLQLFLKKREEFRQDEKGTSAEIKKRIVELVEAAKSTEDTYDRTFYFSKAKRMLDNLPREQIENHDERLVADILLGEIVAFDGSEPSYKMLCDDYNKFKERYTHSPYLEELEKALNAPFDGPPMSSQP